MREKSPSESFHLWSDYRVGVGGGYGGGSTGIKPSLLSSSISLKTGPGPKNNQRRKGICRLRLVAEGLEGLRRLLVDLGVLLRVGELALSDLLALVVGSTLGLAALLESGGFVNMEKPTTMYSHGKDIPGNDVLVLPADLVGETANGAELAAGLQSQDTESLGDYHLLLLVVGRGNTLEDLEALKSGGTASSLVGDHATDGLVEDTRRGAEVEGTYSGQVRHLNVLELSISARRQSRARMYMYVCWLTTASRVVTGHLAQVGVVLDYSHSSVLCSIGSSYRHRESS